MEDEQEKTAPAEDTTEPTPTEPAPAETTDDAKKGDDAEKSPA